MQTRRDFLSKAGMVGALGISKALFPAWMPRLAFRPPAQAQAARDVLVCVFLRGGIDGLTAVAPYGEGAAYYDNRPTQRLTEPGSGVGSAIDLNGFFGFHPALEPLKEVYDLGQLAVVHATGSIDPSRSHFDAMKFMEYGTPGAKNTGTGWIGRHLESAAWQNDSPFRAVGMGAMVPSSLRGNVTPLSLQSIADFHLRGREGELRKMQAALQELYSVQAPVDDLSKQAAMVFETVDMLEQINADGYDPSNGAAYPDDDDGFGRGLKQIAQLIKADVGLEVACIDLGGWDTHENQGTVDGFFNQHLNVLGRGLHAFYTDLQAYMPNISVVTMSEFGRRVAENASSGTDHGHGNFMFVMGGGVQGGQVFARWPGLAPDALSDGDLEITTDYRDVLAEIIRGRLGNAALEQVFPNFTVSPLGLVVAR